MATTKATNGKGKLGTIEVGKEVVPQIGAFGIGTEVPWSAHFTLKGSSSLLFHRFAADEGDGPKGRKGSSKEDNVESYVFRCEDGTIGMPSEYVRQAMIHAAKYRKDPRSSRASAFGLFKAAIAAEGELASLGSDDWDYLDRRRAVVQRSGITRVRPAFLPGWEASFVFNVLLPEYVTPQLFLDVLTDAGKFIGLGDFRPSYGRYNVVAFSAE